jgi:hypothetical protein
MITWLISSPSYSIMLFFTEPGGHRYFELSKPLLSLSPPNRGTRPAQAK